MKHAALLAGSCLLLLACSDSSTSPDDDGTTTQISTPTFVGATGVTIREVAIYQGLKRDLMLAGAAQTEGVPLIQGRDAVIRVFYDADGTYDGKEVKAQLAIDGADPIEVTGVLGPASKDEDMASTVNFSVPGALIGASLSYSVSLLEEADPAADNAAAHWPASDKQTVAIEGPPNKFRVIMVPFQYDFDGSHRLPDTSAATVENYRNRLKQLYPVSDVEVTVHAPIPWSAEIGPDGTGWQAVGLRVLNLRSQENVSDDVYFYGVFVPDASFNQYCGLGCLLGVTLLNDQPADVGSVNLRLALGVGYEEYATDTMAHELGHAHGREHANCGQGIDPQSIDQNYPYPGGQIGVWGLDSATLELHPPTTNFDIMGYCDNNWISDYNYLGLFNRAKNVNLPRWHEPTNRRRMAIVALGGDGSATFGGFDGMPSELGGRRLPTKLSDAEGRTTNQDAIFFGYDHMPGGLALVPVDAKDPSEIRIELDGIQHVVHPGS